MCVCVCVRVSTGNSTAYISLGGICSLNKAYDDNKRVDEICTVSCGTLYFSL